MTVQLSVKELPLRPVRQKKEVPQQKNTELKRASQIPRKAAAPHTLVSWVRIGLTTNLWTHSRWSSV